MKRSLTILLAIFMIMSLLVGCGQEVITPSPSPSHAQPSSTGETQPEQTDSSGEVPKPAGFPAKNINWIAPVAAGAAVDLSTRGLANFVDIGKPIVIENIAGASQTLGTAEALARKADGYTWLTMANACGITQPLMNDLAYELSDFRHIVMLAPYVQAVIAVRADSDIKDINDWLALLSSGEKYTFGIPNAGGYAHVAVVSALNQLGHFGDPNGTMMVYNGGAENITACLSGEADFIVPDSTDAISRVKAGELRVIGVLHDEICELFPEAPLLSNHGVKDLGTFIGLKWISVRADTPDEIVSWLKQELNKAIQNEEYQNYLVQQGFGKLRTYTEEEINEILNSASKDYLEVLKIAGLVD